MADLSIGLYFSAALALIYLGYYCYRPASIGKSVVKTGSIAVLCLVSVLAGGPVWLSLALGFCALGDYLLATGSQTGFMAGIGAFAFGHIAYSVAFLTHALAQPALVLAAPQLLVAVAMTGFAVIMAKLLFRRAGGLGGAVLAYIPIISGMGIASLVLTETGLFNPVFFGAILFVISDFVLSVEKFVLASHARLGKITPFLVWPTYWFAQVLLLVGILGLVG